MIFTNGLSDPWRGGGMLLGDERWALGVSGSNFQRRKRTGQGSTENSYVSFLIPSSGFSCSNGHFLLEGAVVMSQELFPL